MSFLKVTKASHHRSMVENKIILIGNAGVGKTSIIDRYTKGIFIDQQGHKTLDQDVVQKLLNIQGKNYLFVIWDTAGQELYRSVTRTHYHDAKGIFLVYDVSSEESFNGLEYWTKELTENGQFDPKTCIILANKCDLSGVQYTKPLSELDNYYKGYKLKFETSAKDGKGIDKAFQTMCENIIEKNFSVSCDEHYDDILHKHQTQYGTGTCFCK
ncbi:Guanine nucleotide regulatory protein [Oopsacas minuta]|uniref:Guanine nucleotide regulatory protein n=1 Tax=Oopsacas minuta TaxID=111878 RepID=A0AAV7K601_9METZ|nr:Guanine nucleotide regulatory protein [Oopsacas minuta]